MRIRLARPLKDPRVEMCRRVSHARHAATGWHIVDRVPCVVKGRTVDQSQSSDSFATMTIATRIRAMDITLDHLIMHQSINDVGRLVFRCTDDGMMPQEVAFIDKGIDTHPARRSESQREPWGAPRAGQSKLTGKEQEIRTLLQKHVSKASIARIVEVSPTTLHHFIKTRKLQPAKRRSA